MRNRVLTTAATLQYNVVRAKLQSRIGFCPSPVLGPAISALAAQRRAGWPSGRWGPLKTIEPAKLLNRLFDYRRQRRTGPLLHRVRKLALHQPARSRRDSRENE